jgi:hypothetical protein
MAIPKPRFSRRHLPRRLRRLIGVWKVEGAFVGGTEVLKVSGRATFSWLVKDALVILRVRTTVAPWSTAIIGADNEAKELVMLYSDVRGVVRRYEVSLTATRWTFGVERHAFISDPLPALRQMGARCRSNGKSR